MATLRTVAPIDFTSSAWPAQNRAEVVAENAEWFDLFQSQARLIGGQIATDLFAYAS
jgi:hypothetical protein